MALFTAGALEEARIFCGAVFAIPNSQGYFSNRLQSCLLSITTINEEATPMTMAPYILTTKCWGHSYCRHLTFHHYELRMSLIAQKIRELVNLPGKLFRNSNLMVQMKRFPGKGIISQK